MSEKRQRPESQRPRPEALPPLPRQVKYAWGVALTALVALSMFVDRSSVWMPLINRAIDALQLQTGPSENR